MIRYNKEHFSVVLLLVIALSGYIMLYFSYKNNIKLEQEVLNYKVSELEIINDSLAVVRDAEVVTMKELTKSRDRLNMLIDAAAKRDTAKLSLEDALKIIEGIK